MPSSGSSIFRKLLLSAFLLLAFALIVLDFYLTRYTAARETRNVELRLVSEAHLVAYELANAPAPELTRLVSEAGHRAETRITLITPDGVVLADSEHDPETMENHAGRPEVRQALQGRIGASVRHSATLDRDLCYVALPFAYRGHSGFVLRLAVPLIEVSSAVSAVRWRIIYASIATAALALLLGYYFSVRMSRRIGRIKAFAERLLVSKEQEALIPEANDELGALSRALNHMGRQLRESMENLKIEAGRRDAILASMIDGLLAVDQDLRILFCNDSFARMIGVDSPGVKGTALLSTIRDSSLFTIIENVLASGEPAKGRVQLALAGDRVFDVHAAPLLGQKALGAVAVLHEITEIERLERVRQDFVANVSHELRTPLTAILGYAETLLEGAVDDIDTRKKFLETIKAHAIRLNNISADLLVLSELDSGASVTPPSTFSIRDAIASAMRTVESEAAIRRVELTCGDISDVAVRGHRLRLEQALVNLLDNAIKFNHPGGRANVEGCQTLAGQVKITIADTGSGIPAQDLSRIFERFYRVDRARSRAVGGTGLGLAIVKHAVELMDGTIEVTSELGRGSAFTLSIPIDLTQHFLPPH